MPVSTLTGACSPKQPTPPSRSPAAATASCIAPLPTTTCSPPFRARHSASTTASPKKAFENCIIYGLGGDINEGTLDDSNVYMHNVLFKSSGEDDSHFLNCVWGEDPLYYTVREDYIFDYRLRPESPAIGRGDSSFVTDLCRFDWYGMDRLAAGAPDLGAYVYTVPKEDDDTQEQQQQENSTIRQ